MATAWISFGPDLEPLESESRRGAQTPQRRRDGMIIAGSAEEVVARLVEAAAASAGWCRLDQVCDDGTRLGVFVNAGAVRLVSDEGDRLAAPGDIVDAR